MTIILILLPPLIGCLTIPFIDKINSKFIPYFSVTTLLITAVTSVYGFIRVIQGSWSTIRANYMWMGIDGSNLGLSVTIDSLSIFMSAIASGIGLLIAIFSIEYMDTDKSKLRYWFFIQLFIVSMNILVLAGDFLTLFIGWELVGLCSFMLIGHFSYKQGNDGQKARKAGIKAFLFTNLADSGFFLSLALIYAEFGSFDFDVVRTGSSSSIIIPVGLIVAAFGKSAQFPFIPWLSSPDRVDIDAMQGPTTVSALIHAATMVKAGIYLVSRTYLIFNLDSEEFYWFIIVVTGITALIAALSALTSIGIKRILAYSTVSQLSYMFMSLGVAFAATNEDLELSRQAFVYAQFHLLAHAIFKSLLFLSAAYIIHSFHEKRITHLKGVASWQKNKILTIGVVSGSLALSGIPPFVGYFSKESIISVTYILGYEHGSSIGKVAYILAILTAIVTSGYCARFIHYLVLQAPEKGNPSEYKIMPGILGILSLFSLFGGLFSLAMHGYFKDVSPTQGGEDPLSLHALLATGTIIGVFALSLVVLNSQLANRLTSMPIIRFIYILSKEGFYLDDLWQFSWRMLRDFVSQLRKLHTGDLNWVMALFALVALGAIGTLGGAIL